MGIEELLAQAELQRAQYLEKQHQLETEINKLDLFIELQKRALKIRLGNAPDRKISVAKRLLEMINSAPNEVRAKWLIETIGKERVYMEEESLRVQCYNALRRLEHTRKVQRPRKGVYLNIGQSINSIA